MELIANNLIEIRELTDNSRKQMAAKLNISPEEYTQYENCETSMPISLIARLKKEFNINLNWFFTGEGNRFHYCDLQLLQMLYEGKTQEVFRKKFYQTSLKN